MFFSNAIPNLAPPKFFVLIRLSNSNPSVIPLPITVGNYYIWISYAVFAFVY